MRNISAIKSREIKTHILRSITFMQNILPFMG